MEKEAAEVPQRDPAATEVLCRPEVLCGEKEAAEVPQRDPVATEVLCRPEVLCWKRKRVEKEKEYSQRDE